jgi:methyl coenzyme M reductase subunit C
MTACDDRSPVERENDLAQQGVLTILLEAHPGPRSIEEVVREMTADCPGEFVPRDRVEDAIRDLVGAGLLHRHGPFVFATRAAVRSDELRT